MKRGQEQRERGLGDAGARQRRRVGGQTVVGAQALDERVEKRPVHDERPEQAFRGCVG